MRLNVEIPYRNIMDWMLVEHFIYVYPLSRLMSQLTVSKNLAQQLI